MKKLCYGVLLACSIMFGLSLSVFCDDSSALQHEWTSIPLYRYVFPDYNTYDVDLVLGYSSSVNVPSGLKVVDPIYFTGNYSDSVCSYNQIKHSLIVYDNLAIEYSVGYQFYQYFPSISTSDYRMCQIYGHSYLQGNIPFYNWDSVPAVAGGDFQMNTQYPKTFSPYWYSFDGYYLRNSAVDTHSGVHYSHTLRASELFGTAPGKFSRFTMPLPVDVSVVGPMTAGRSFEVNGAFDFSDTMDFEFASDFSSDGRFELEVQSDSFVERYSCSVNLRTVESANFQQLEYSCPFVAPSSSTYYSFNLQIHAGSSGYVWDTTSDWKWAGLYVVTDGDSTPGADPSLEIHSSNPDLIPGSATRDFESDSADWFSSLTNLFNFSIANPFAPIFQMFSDNSECASIPIIAGMLGTEETIYCPWFDSTTRNVLSPVLGLSSIMLLFGFFVRWLGSSSGNMFEDQTSHKWTNTTFRQKGGK